VRVAAQRAIHIADAIGRPLIALNAEILDAWGAAAEGESGALGRFDRAWETADRGNHPWLAFLATWVPVPVSWWTEGSRGLRARLARELDRPRSAAAAGQRRYLTNFSAQPEAMAGRLDAAEALVEEAPLAAFRMSEIMLNLYRRGPEPAMEHVRAMVAEGERTGNSWTEIWAGNWWSRCIAATGDFRAAAEHHQARTTLLDSADAQGFAAHERLVQALWHVRAGDADAAAALIATARPFFPGEDAGLGHTRLVAAEAGLAALKGDAGAAEAGFTFAIADLERRDNLFDAAEFRRAWGALTRRTEPLDAAIAFYREAGAAESLIDLALSERDGVAAPAPR
jgi:hypothetical protein